MRLEPLYTIRFFYPEGWNVNLAGKKVQRRTITTSRKESAKERFQESFVELTIPTDTRTRPS
jgi:hypothetical protein